MLSNKPIACLAQAAPIMLRPNWDSGRPGFDSQTQPLGEISRIGVSNRSACKQTWSLFWYWIFWFWLHMLISPWIPKWQWIMHGENQWVISRNKHIFEKIMIVYILMKRAEKLKRRGLMILQIHTALKKRFCSHIATKIIYENENVLMKSNKIWF